MFKPLGWVSPLKRDLWMRTKGGSDSTSRTPTNHGYDEEHDPAKRSEKKQGKTRKKIWRDRRQGKCYKDERLKNCQEIKSGEGYLFIYVILRWEFKMPFKFSEMEVIHEPNMSHFSWTGGRNKDEIGSIVREWYGNGDSEHKRQCLKCFWDVLICMKGRTATKETVKSGVNFMTCLPSSLSNVGEDWSIFKCWEEVSGLRKSGDPGNG